MKNCFKVMQIFQAFINHIKHEVITILVPEQCLYIVFRVTVPIALAGNFFSTQTLHNY